MSSYNWTENDMVNFAKFVIDNKSAPFTIEDEHEMKQCKFNEGMFLGVKFSRFMQRAIVKHHHDAVTEIFKKNGVLDCAPKPVDGFCPIAIRAKLLPFMRQDKLVVVHEDDEITIDDDVVDRVQVEVTTCDGGIRIGFTNRVDPIRDRAHHEFYIDVDDLTTKKEIDDKIVAGFTHFVKKVVVFTDQDRLTRYT